MAERHAVRKLGKSGKFSGKKKRIFIPKFLSFFFGNGLFICFKFFLQIFLFLFLAGDSV